MTEAKYFKTETFGAVDGPGTRLVIFLQGCPLRCVYCHNPESWEIDGSDKTISVNEIINLYKVNENFYKNGGGITISGGEPCLHMDFLISLGKRCKKEGIHLTIDTSGYFYKKAYFKKMNELIKYVDLFLVDIKQINNKKYSLVTRVDSSKQSEVEFVRYLEKNEKHYWIRQVLVPGYTDDKNDLVELGRFMKDLKYMDKFELLPYHNMAVFKYKNLKIKYVLKNIEPPTIEEIRKAMEYIKEGMGK